MNFDLKFLLKLFSTFSILLGHIECKSYFGIGNRYFGDQLILRDVVENRHTGIFEVPVIAFEYAVKEPITFLEIVSEENVSANVSFSYYDDVINGSVLAITSNVSPDGSNLPFTICISIYGFNDTETTEFFAAETLRQEQYNGELKAQPKPGEIDHLPLKLKPIEDFTEIETNFLNRDFSEESDNDFEDEDDETFESMDLFLTLGYRQKGDELLFETYQYSELTTKNKTEHVVIFYFVDNVFITYIEFVIIDYKANKTAEEIENGYFITYHHYTPSTIKAVIQTFNTTSLVAKIYIYGYRETKRPMSYVSYIPKKHQMHNLFLSRFVTTESPVMQLRTQLNALQRNADGLGATIPADYYRSQQEEDSAYIITSISEVRGTGCANLNNLTFRTLIKVILLWTIGSYLFW